MVDITEPLVVIGGGGFGREVLDVIEAINQDAGGFGTPLYEVVGVLAEPAPDEELLGHYNVKYLGPVSSLEDTAADVGYVIGIGSGRVRRDIDEYGLRLGRPSPTLVHPSATLGREVDLGPGVIVCSHVSLTNHIRVGRHVHLNLNSTVGHDSRIGDYVTVAPLAAISGNVTLGDEATIGTGASINEKLTIGPRATIGAGAAVVRDVEPRVTVAGVPARPLR